MEMEDEFIQAICAGEYDEELQNITDAVQHRKMELEPFVIKDFNFKIGDTIKFNSHIGPTYLIGRSAPIIKLNPKSVKVQMPVDPTLRRFSGKRVRIPHDLIEGKVETHA